MQGCACDSLQKSIWNANVLLRALYCLITLGGKSKKFQLCFLFENKDVLVKWNLFAILLKLKIIALSRFNFYLGGQHSLRLWFSRSPCSSGLLFEMATLARQTSGWPKGTTQHVELCHVGKRPLSGVQQGSWCRQGVQDKGGLNWTLSAVTRAKSHYVVPPSPYQ